MINWIITLPYRIEDNIRVTEYAEKLEADFVRCKLPPEKIIIKSIGHGNYLYDILKEYFSHLPVELES